jgi:hypothetical protein
VNRGATPAAAVATRRVQMRKVVIAAAVVILLIVTAALFLGSQVRSTFQNTSGDVGSVSASPGDNDVEELNTDAYRNGN